MCSFLPVMLADGAIKEFPEKFGKMRTDGVHRSTQSRGGYNMRTEIRKMMAFVSVLVMVLIPSLSLAQSGGGLTQKGVDTRLALRGLWEGHIFWVRNVVFMTKLGNKAGAKTAEEQVVENAKDISNAIVPFYGKEAGDKLFGLLAEHYGAVKEYMNADFAGKKDAKEKAMAKMLKNADDIATFLSSANPNWPKEAVLGALKTHGGFHMTQIEQVKAKNFAGEAKTWSSMKAQIDQVADVLTDGLMKQFPQKFA